MLSQADTMRKVSEDKAGEQARFMVNVTILVKVLYQGY